jgi:hypothetical protein
MAKGKGKGPVGFTTGPLSRRVYGNFYQTQFLTIGPNAPIPFNGVGQTQGMFLVGTTDIHVIQAGDYFVSYTITVTPNGETIPLEQQAAIFINGVIVPNFQTDFGIRFSNPADTGDCRQLHGEAIIFIPANAFVELRNVSSGNRNMHLCDTFESGAAINLIKVS